MVSTLPQISATRCRRTTREVTLGLYGSEGRFSQRRRERVFDGAGALTDRQERFDREDEDLGGSLNASAQLGAWVMNANVGMSRFESDGGELSRRFPGAAGSAPVALFQGEVEMLRERRSASTVSARSATTGN